MMLPVLTLLLLLSLAPADSRAAAGAPAREGWGFGLGAGPGLGGEGDELAFGPGASLRVTYTFNEWVGFGVESNVWAPDITVANYRTSVMAGAVSLYPFGGPFVLRLGAGLGTHERRYRTNPYAPSSPLTTYSYSGLGVTAGAGLEFGFASHFSIGPALDVTVADADGLNGYINATLQLNWYPGRRP
jgi:hypothetical protein